jgi:endonuclease YncB( thermonuclease family)
MTKKERVTKVIDGDTFQTSSRKCSVRLANVDAPEKGEPGAAKAKRALSNLIQGQQVQIDTVARDTYGRAVAKVKVDGKSVNAAMNRTLKK